MNRGRSFDTFLHYRANFADSTVKVEVEVLHTEVVHAVVKLAMELLLTKVGKACNGISDIARCNSRL